MLNKNNVAVDGNFFRPIHYLGSKLRVLDRIGGTVAEVRRKQGAVVDLFSGSGTVSMALGSRFKTYAVDIQEFARVLGSAVLAPHRIPEHFQLVRGDGYDRELTSALDRALEPLTAFEVDATRRAMSGDPVRLASVIQHGSLESYRRFGLYTKPLQVEDELSAVLNNLTAIGMHNSRRTIVTRYFGGVYFSYRQALEIDLLLDLAHGFDDLLRDSAIASVLSTASDVVNTVGKQFAQPLRAQTKTGTYKTRLSQTAIRDRSLDIAATHTKWIKKYNSLASPPRGEGVALRQDYRNFLQALPSDVSAVYADPPYTRDHYSRYYHVLETMCLRDEPEISASNLGSGNTPSRGIYRADRHQSPFSIKSQVRNAFEDLFCPCSERGIPLVLSYSPFARTEGNRPRLLDLEQIVNIAETYYTRVEVVPLSGIAHSKFNSTELNKPVPEQAEVLVLCQSD